MANKIAGYFYWLPTDRNFIASTRIPIDSPTPEPKPWLMKIPLSETEMNISLLILEKRYPCTVEKIEEK